MKLTVLALLLSILGSWASQGYSQTTRLNLAVKNVTIEEFFRKIEDQSEYRFFYSGKIDVERTISGIFENKLITEVLDDVLKNSNITYEMKGRQIILSPAETSSSVNQQHPKSVFGKVTDSTGAPLPGVTVVIKGTTKGTITITDGMYSLGGVSGDAILVFSFVGMKTQEIPVGGKTTINVILAEEIVGLDEVVAVGYGVQKRTDVTGSIVSVKSQALENLSAPTLDSRLQGQISGVNIYSTSGEPGGNLNIRIRGNNSVSADNSPLIVLDGYPLPPPSEATAWGPNGINNDMPLNVLSSINPDDIQSVEVLKDASATAIYGARGANGVIVITTKSGKKGQSEINFTVEQGISPIPKYFALMSGPEYATFQNDVSGIQGNTPKYTSDSQYGAPEDQITTKWLNEISQMGNSQRYNLSLRGGNDIARYFVSADYTDQNGTINNSRYQRGNMRANIDANVNDRLKIMVGFNYNRTAADRRSQTSFDIQVGGPVFKALLANPALAAKDDQGFLQEIDPATGAFFPNPLSEVRDLFDYTDNQSTLINLQLTYKISNGLRFVFSGGNNNSTSLRQQFYPFNTAGGYQYNGRGVDNSTQVNDYRVEPYLTYSKIFSGHKINATAGYTYTTNINKGLLYSTYNFPVDDLGANALQLGQDIFYRNNYKTIRTLSSVYYRLNYDYRSKYYLSVTGRYDGSSVLAPGNQWKFFPAASVGWTISNESFLKGNPKINLLKLRASYGATGSQSVPAYSSKTLLVKANYDVNGSEAAGQGLSSFMGNTNLTWEKTIQTDIGLDLGLFDDRLSFVADVYQKTTEGLLQNRQLPMSSGFSTTYANLGTIENRGIEASISGDIIKKSAFKWSGSVNFTLNRTNVKDLGGPDVIIEGPYLMNYYMTYPSNIMQQGEPFGAFKGYRVIGLIQESDFDSNGKPTFAMMNNDHTLGAWKFADLNNDGVINEADRTIIGDPNPKFSLGWSNTFTYKRFTLSSLVFANMGFDIINAANAFIKSGFYGSNQRQDWFDNRWTTENPHNNPKYPSYNGGNNLQVNDQMIEDGSYVRLKNISLSYKIPPGAVKFVKNAQVYVNATDLLTITNYSGFDPEVNAQGTNNIVQNVDLGGYPRAKTFMLGIKIGF